MSANESTRERLSQGVMSIGDGMRIFPDVEACIDCGGCVVACKRTWDIPVDDQRIDITTMLEGVEGESGFNGRQVSAIEEGMNPGETSLPMQCYHCENAPCVSVCPTNALQKKDNGFVEVVDDLCIGCQYCLSACPFGAPQFPESNDGLSAVVGSGGVMDKCTGCEERQDVGQGPACAEECATDAILVGSSGEIADELEKRDSGAFFNDTALEIIFGDDAGMFDR
ncbi:4Fe-4S dicluster domain-containing protein [Halalkalicoccus sp. NIPERK01]|uniref:4Fe-4S dicluster domain-containing protein n=1 Tax=Halalkalicoccus sp. NIPERK01 TaxID=3053469 RepID=UPI00256F50C1|nr:4Fe-4S dicluster domain-containing protein [Halalkalicoccus sp. NIPERK01]MDL5362121.1 4Fe-4S dicluster domain-containing protein [Halalkalicoccus sp. NIPERK01]